MPFDADDVARGSAATWERFVGAVPGGWTRREGGTLGVMSGVVLPGFNGVWGETRDVDPDTIGRLLDDVRAAGVPFCMQLRHGWPVEVDEIARRRGLARGQGEPVMVLDDVRALDRALSVGDLRIRQLGPDEGGVHAAVAAAGGVVGAELPYRSMTVPEVLCMPGLRCYVGEVGGVAVTTAIGCTAGDCVGIFAVATLSDYRRRGFGAAVTARAARDGLDSGAGWAWLSASAAGFGVYVGIGFVAVEWLDIWEPSGRGPAGCADTGRGRPGPPGEA